MSVLYIVATPIGNLEDMTFRAVRTLREVNLIACEDTRVTRKLLGHYEIPTRVLAYHAYSSAHVTAQVLDVLEAGQDVALVSDAGTPLMSDPGAELVQGAISRGFRVVPIPGPSAITTALSAAGVPTSAFVFLGFLPRQPSRRRETLARLSDAPYSVVIFEAPSRLLATLEELHGVFGDRDAVVARELTKHFETLERGRISMLVERFKEAPRGEIVIVVAPPPLEVAANEALTGAANLRSHAEKLLASGVAPSEAAKILAGAYGLSKRRAYEMILDVKATAHVGADGE